ncbi:MAG: hypothetical protein MUC49_15680 [Raineya sp.]|jgi:hypothetical protein|nr:hypothetical protein [Raineya sp.]
MEDYSQYYFSFFLWYRHSRYHRLEAEFYYFLALCGNIQRAEEILSQDKGVTGQKKIKLDTWKAWLINHPRPSLIR